jgi:hypothetical protein
MFDRTLKRIKKAVEDIFKKLIKIILKHNLKRKNTQLLLLYIYEPKGKDDYDNRHKYDNRQQGSFDVIH